MLGDQNRAIGAANVELARLDEVLAQLERERRLLLMPSGTGVTPGEAVEDPKPGKYPAPDDGTRDSAHHQLVVSAPIGTEFVSDITEYRALVEAEEAERVLLDRISAAERDSRISTDEALREALEAFGVRMRIMFQDGSEAERSWREYLTRHGDQEAVAALRTGRSWSVHSG